MPQFLALLSIVIILGSFFYYVYALTNGVILFILAVVLILAILLRRSGGFLLSGVEARAGTVSGEAGRASAEAVRSLAGRPNEAKEKPPERLNQIIKILFLIPLLPLAAAFFILFTHQTTEALRSPWEVVPPYFFLLYGAAVFLLVVRKGAWRRNCHRATYEASASLVPPKADCGWLNKNEQAAGSAVSVRSRQCGDMTLEIIPLILLTFLTLSISLIVFPLGYGFDPFIHQATEKIIAATGTITPKPLYYIGQYSLVVFLSKILGISVVWIDKLLVPLLASILIPWSIKLWWKKRDDMVCPRLSLEQNRLSLGQERSVVQESSPGRSITYFAFLSLPFLLTPFTVTTPYSLALLFLFILIFYTKRNVDMDVYAPQSLTQAGAGMVPPKAESEGRVGVRRQRWTAAIASLWSGSTIATLLLATATLLIHPLVGIPAFIFLIVKRVQGTGYRVQIFTYAFCVVLIPTAFLISSQLSSQIHITFAPKNFLPWLQSLSWSGIYRENRFNAPLDLLYFYGFNIKNIFWFFVLTPLILQIKRWRQSGAVLSSGIADQSGHGSADEAESGERQAVSRRAGTANEAREDAPEWRQKSYLLTFLILLTSYILMSGFLSFNFLIGYEQADYAKRVLDIAQLFLIPFFLLGIHWWLYRVPRAVAILLITLGITASLFLTYPQKVDSYAVSHAFNTSQADIDAVRWIDADAKGEDYIVLANQAVSAAAIRELGFKKYYQAKSTNYPLPTTNSIFFYPIPTGSPLYQYYLSMVYKNASSETLLEAINFTKAQRGYFVLNHYWNDFDRILAEAQQNLQLLHSVNPVRSHPADPDRNSVSDGASGTATTASGRSASNGVNSSVFIFTTK